MGESERFREVVGGKRWKMCKGEDGVCEMKQGRGVRGKDQVIVILVVKVVIESEAIIKVVVETIVGHVLSKGEGVPRGSGVG